MNDNGLIERAEVGPLLRPRFEALDQDGSGALDRTELTRHFLANAGDRLRRPPTVTPWDPVQPATAGEIDLQLQQMTSALALRGAVLLCGAQGHELFRGASGDLDASTPVPMASATKWVSAIILMQAVEAGHVTLDAPIHAYLPDARAGWRDMSLRQMFSHTSGAPRTHALRHAPDAGVADVAVALMRQAPDRPPGAGFAYGGASMQIGAYAVERASGASWRELFERGVGRRLNLSSGTRYGHPVWYDPDFEITTPNVAAGMWSTGEDYLRIVSALAFPTDATRLLSDDSMAEIESDYSSTLPQVFRPSGVLGEWSYGLGLWCERRTGARCSAVSSAGAYGSYPWIDRESGHYGVLVTLGELRSVLPFALRPRGMCAVVPD